MKQYFNDDFKHFLHGGDYNPEQWGRDEKILNEDMRLLRLANCNELTIGVFSWSTLEPNDGEYDFSFIDDALDRLYSSGARAILATPSGSRPRWMALSHPEVLRDDENGVKYPFGHRHNHCPTSPYFRKKIKEMDERLSKKYGKHPAVLGWHISNELGGACYCQNCRKAFRVWLKNKYNGNIDKLNFEWWNKFWSHDYGSFDDIEPPSARGDYTTALTLDWNRFVTDITTDFIRWETAAIRKYSDLPTTVNMMHRYTGLNYSKMFSAIDIASWDSYPTWHNSDYGADSDIRPAVEAAISHDAMRAGKGRPFLLMESTPSYTNWQAYAKLKRPGMHKLSSIQAVAHGADSVLYFQWRKSRGSDEKLHGAVIDHLGEENTRVFKEVREVGSALMKIEELLGTMPKPRVAVIFDVECDWALSSCQGFKNSDKKYYDTAYSFYYEFWRRAIDVDVISPDADLSRYELVIAPMLYLVSEELGARLSDYVKGGGRLVSGYTLAMVNENDLCYLGGFPGAGLRSVFGIWNEEIDTLYPDDKNYAVMGGVEYPLCDYCERIHPEGAEVLAVYRDDFYKNEPTVTVNSYGKGKAYYIAARDTGELKSALLEGILDELKIEGNLKAPPRGVSAHSRYDGDTKYLFVENYNNTNVTVTLPECLDLEWRRELSGSVQIPPYGVKILRVKAGTQK